MASPYPMALLAIFCAFKESEWYCIQKHIILYISFLYEKKEKEVSIYSDSYWVLEMYNEGEIYLRKAAKTEFLF